MQVSLKQNYACSISELLLPVQALREYCMGCRHCPNFAFFFFFFFMFKVGGGEFNTKATKKGYERLFCGLVRAEDVIEVEYNGVGNTLCG